MRNSCILKSMVKNNNNIDRILNYKNKVTIKVKI